MDRLWSHPDVLLAGRTAPLVGVIAVLSVAVVIWISRRSISQWRSVGPDHGREKVPVTQELSVKIDPLRNFDWATTEPLVLRPFKSAYHMTMGIARIPASELCQIDKHYRDRLRLRHHLLQTRGKQVVQALPGTQKSTRELYTWMMTYLSTRYPTIFTILCNADGQHLLNTVTGDEIPCIPAPNSDPEDLLKALGSQVEEDFFILQPDEDDEGGEFRLKAYVGCFPNGFDWSQKIGKTMTEIHQPVPNYESKLQKSMNRYLSRLEPGGFVTRSNWSLATKGDMFAVANVHLYKGEKIAHEEVDHTKAFLRCERQCLHRLAGTRDVVLTIHTYMYPLSEIKAEGSGPAMAAAIDGLQKGNSPDMYFYKRAPNWGQSIKEYLLDGQVFKAR